MQIVASVSDRFPSAHAVARNSRDSVSCELLNLLARRKNLARGVVRMVS